ncbi:hypothetical protein V1525DRAFT_412340 [Lipomyces kononenkoae]|uniref:Uncharacterized protein n=1 Tax=Lipomyces kononenkoae TaxID=34357 RepID=A0ACC3SSS4_LIPKO
MHLSISVDNPVISAGSPLSGIVDLVLDKPAIIDAIRVRFRGISMTTTMQFSEQMYSVDLAHGKFKVKEWHLHVDVTTFLFRGQNGTEMAAGRYRFPYIINVPVFSRCDCLQRLEEYRVQRKRQTWICTAAASRTVGATPLPPSLKTNNDRYVRYRIMALVERPGKMVFNRSKVKNIIVVPVTLIHTFDPYWNDRSRLIREISGDAFSVKCERLPDNYFQDGSLQRSDELPRSLVSLGPKGTNVKVPTQLEVVLFNDGDAAILEPLKLQIYAQIQVDCRSRIDGILNIKLTSMRITMKSLTTGLATSEKTSVIKNTLFRANALDITLQPESDSGPPRFRLDTHAFEDLDISKIVPTFHLLSMRYHHQLVVTVGLSFNGGSAKILKCLCPINVVSGVDYDLDTQRLMPPRYNLGDVQFDIDDRLDDNDGIFDW